MTNECCTSFMKAWFHKLGTQKNILIEDLQGFIALWQESDVQFVYELHT
jgi:hypothetical protein